MRLRRLFHVGTVVLLVFCVDEGAPTLMLTSMLMAVKSGLMVGKMSLGGLIMMLMAANQNQNEQAARQNSIIKQTPLPFDILSLLGSHSNNVPVTVTSSPKVPVKFYSAPTTLSPTTTPIIKVSRRRVFKKKVIVRRDLSNRTLVPNDKNETTAGENEIKDSPTLVKTMKDETITTNEIKDSPTLETIFDDSITNEIKKVLSLQKLEHSASKVNGTVAAEEKEVQTRIFRQISNLDPLNCLPKVMCGINTAPPSKKTNILNDYAYLMKTIFSRDDDDDNDKKPVTKSDKKKKKNKRKGGNKKKNDEDSDESFEEFVLNDDDFERLALKEEADIEDLVQHDMADEEPGFLPYILKDAQQMTESSETNQDYPADDLGHEGENEYPHSHSPPGGYPYRSSQNHHVAQHHSPRPNNSPGSLLSSFIPQISFGKNKGGKGDAFSSDPFFDGFKRSLDFNATEGTKTLNITKEQDQLLKEIKMRRDKRNVYVMGKKKQIEMTNDPGEKFQIAAEVGRKTKSARECRALFDQCPFKYTEVLKMISNLRNAVQGQVENTADKVVNLVQTVPIPKVTAPVQPVAAPSNIINVSSGGGGEHGGITSISHQLPNGEKIEINLKVLGKTTTPTTTTSSTTTTTLAPPRTNATKLSGKHPNDAEKIFDDEHETHSQPLRNPTAQHTNKKTDSLESLESLKATLMAIEKINNATLDRKKQGKPITYSGIFHEVTGIGPIATERVPNESSDNESRSSSESYEDDEEEEDLPAPPPNIIKQPNLPELKRPYRLRQAPQDQKHPYRLQRPSSTSQTLDDEHTNPFPPRRPQIRPQLRPQFHINKQQHRIHARTTTPTTTTTTPKTESTTLTPKATASTIRNKKKPVATKPKGHKSQKDEPVIVPYTEKEAVANPTKQKVSSKVNTESQPDKKPSGAENSEDYDEGDIDGDDNDNNTSEEDEEDDELRSDESGYVEHRLNIPHRPPHPHPQFIQNDSDDNEDDEADSDRIVIQPSITGNAQQQMQRSPPPPPPPHSHPPNQSRPPQPPNPPQHLPQLRPNFHHRRLKVSKSRTKRSRFPTNRRTVKRKHPNHRYPCSAPVEATTPATDNIKNHSLEDRQPIASPSTLSPPSLPFKYPQYRSPHKM